MRAGFYKDDLEDFEKEGLDDVNDVAEIFADDNHQIDEASDMEFHVYVEDDNHVLHKVSMITEYDPRFCVDKTEIIQPENIYTCFFKNKYES